MVDMSGVPPAPILLPAHRDRVDQWQQKFRGGAKEDRLMREVTVSLPPKIADLTVRVPAGLLDVVQQATQEITRLDVVHGHHLSALSALLLRAESVASSKIERVEASMDDYARALHGHKGNTSATSMVASTRALRGLIESTQEGAPITWDAVLSAHEILMRDDPEERAYAGKIRDMQNWIGGSKYSPRNALFVPPPPETLEDYIEDLVRFMNRTDIDVFLQAAIAHAQFESIHPFTDGNGRIGRALINAILRKRGVTTCVVVPLASAMVANRDTYFLALDLYRIGDAEVLLMLFVLGSLIAAIESGRTAQRLAALPDEWRRELNPRANSAGAALLGDLLDLPVFSADDVVERTGRSETAVYEAINQLVNHGIVRPVTRRKKDKIWVVASLVDELDELNERISVSVNKSKSKGKGQSGGADDVG